MDISVRRVGDATVVAAAGELDLEVADTLRGRLNEVIVSGPDRLVVDLSGATFIDSTILGVLVGTRNQLGGGELHVVAAHPAVLKIFQMTGLDQVFRISPTLPA